MTYLLIALAAYGCLVGYVTYGVGPFHYRYSRPVAWLLNRMHMAFITIGAICFTDSPGRVATWQQDRHERHHTRQWRAWLLLMPPVYLALLAIYGYNRHPQENAARRAAGQPERK